MAEERKSVPEILFNKKLGTTTENLNKVSRSSFLGTLDTSIGDTFFGINHRQTQPAIQVNKDVTGFTFFTKPECNLSGNNIENLRHFVPMLNSDEYSLPRVLRAYLDPSLSKRSLNPIRCSLVDEANPFIPLLTNNLLTLSGWPDFSSPTYSSPEGVQNEVFGFVDGVSELHSTYDLSASFRNIPGDPITNLFLLWGIYQESVAAGVIAPYPNHVYQNTIDYSTCIWRVGLDVSKRFVQKICRTGGAFPIMAPIGASFNFDNNKHLIDANDQVNITFRAFGASYQDPILIYEFNETVFRANPGLKKASNRGAPYDTSKEFVRMPTEAGNLLNHRGYPLINPDTYELEWYITNADWKKIVGEIENNSVSKLRDTKAKL